MFFLAFPGAAIAAKPEDVFKGKIIITQGAPALRSSSSPGRSSPRSEGGSTKIWPKEEKGPSKAGWDLEYIAFFAQPLNDSEVKVKFYELHRGDSASSPAMSRTPARGDPHLRLEHHRSPSRSSRSNKHYIMTVESGRRPSPPPVLAARQGPHYSGKVEFSDEDAKARSDRQWHRETRGRDRARLSHQRWLRSAWRRIAAGGRGQEAGRAPSRPPGDGPKAGAEIAAAKLDALRHGSASTTTRGSRRDGGWPTCWAGLTRRTRAIR